MKRKAAALALAAMAGAATMSAQNYQDGLRFSENEYEGTARTMAMGNAFTALGGDLGSTGINPAGSAVARYSQITFSLGPNISIARTNGNTMPDGSLGFGKDLRNTGATFSVPNFGASLNVNTGNYRGIRNWCVGFVANNTRSYSEDLIAQGKNTTTSAFAALAADAQALAENGDFTASTLDGSSAYEQLGYGYYDIISAFKSGAIGSLSEKKFIGASEYIMEGDENHYLGASGLQQSFGQRVSGQKSDYIFNVGMNISDVVFLGANVGVTDIEYDSTEYLREEAVETGQVPVTFSDDVTTYFESAKKQFSYSARAAGVYGKFGIIAVPFNGFRIGAAIQTPTVLSVKETAQYYAEANYELSSRNGSASSPQAAFEYRLTSPFRANFGIAATFGSRATVSADYELCNYRSMKFAVPGTSDQSDYAAANNGIRDLCGVQHYFRLGAEVKPLDWLALRLGYNLKTSGETHRYNGDKLEKIKDIAKLHTASFGLGYSSKGSFFADLAAVCHFYPKSYISPYGDYSVNGAYHYAPEITCKNRLVKVVATLGWRF